MKRPHLYRFMLATLLLFPMGGFALNATGNAPAPVVPGADLQAKLEALAARAHPGTMGIAVLDLQNGKTWQVNADRAYPMMSVFKAPVAAAVLDRIEHGENSFDQTVTLKQSDLESGPIRNHFNGAQATFTVRELLSYAVSKSDNTAVDALICLIGGPAVVESYLRTHGIEQLHVDRDEAGNTRLFEALRPGESAPANETDAQQDQRYQRGYRLFLADPGNRSTPNAAMLFLHKLWPICWT
jgi:beta-lactamase class A